MKNYRYQSGFNLIEILFSLFLLSMMLLGLDAIAITALREAKYAYFFRVAEEQVNVITERLSLLHDSFNLDEEIMNWNGLNQKLLPEGHGQLSVNDSNYSVEIFWGRSESSLCKHNQIGPSGCIHRLINIEALP